MAIELSTVLLSAIVLSVILIVFSLGTKTTLQDLLFMVRHPMLLGRAFLAIFVIVPAAAVVLGAVFPLSPYTKLVIIALAASPIPPILPVKQENTGAEGRYAVSLLASASVLAFFVTPLVVSSASILLGDNSRISAGDIAAPMLVSLEIPLALGILFGRFVPKWAHTAHTLALKAGIALLLVAGVIVLARQLPTIIGLIGDGTVFAMTGIVCVGLIAGHLLGGPSERDSAALALASATRHPGVTLAIVTANFPEARNAATAACLLFFVINLALTIPYGRWMRRRIGGAPATA